MIEVVRKYNCTYSDSTVMLDVLPSAQYWIGVDVSIPKLVTYGSVSRELVQERLWHIEPDLSVVNMISTPSSEGVHATPAGLRVFSLEHTKEELHRLREVNSRCNERNTIQGLSEHREKLKRLLDKSVSLPGHEQSEWLQKLKESVASLQKHIHRRQRANEQAHERDQYYSDLLDKLNEIR